MKVALAKKCDAKRRERMKAEKQIEDSHSTAIDSDRRASRN